jgi:hypothetical protein
MLKYNVIVRKSLIIICLHCDSLERSLYYGNLVASDSNVDCVISWSSCEQRANWNSRIVKVEMRWTSHAAQRAHRLQWGACTYWVPREAIRPTLSRGSAVNLMGSDFTTCVPQFSHRSAQKCYRLSPVEKYDSLQREESVDCWAEILD